MDWPQLPAPQIFRYARGFVANDGRSASIYATRLTTLAQPRSYLDMPAGEYERGDKYHTERLIVTKP